MSSTSETPACTEKKIDKDANAEVGKKKVLELQQYFYENLGNRTFDYIRWDQRKELESKIGFALFGKPTEANGDTPYNTKNTKEINKICDFIYEIRECFCVYIAFLFIVGETKGGIFTAPVFKILTPDESTIFLDHHLRVYNSWELFLNNNKLPQGNFCYPEDGIYQGDDDGNVSVTFSPSPASKLSSKALNVADVVTTVASFGALGVTLAGAAIAIAPPVAVATAAGVSLCGIYGTARGSHVIHDRIKHKQTVSLKDGEGRKCWISTVGSAVGVVGGLASKGMVNLVTKGKEIGSITRGAINVITGTSLTINGLGVFDGAVNLIVKYKDRELTKLDLAQFSASLLFFVHATVNAKTAKSIIEDMQKECLSSFTADLSNRRTKAFTKLVKKSGGDGSIQSRAKIIRAIQNVDSKDDFFRVTLRGQKQSSSTLINDDGHFEVKGELYVDTKRELQTHVRGNINSQTNFNITERLSSVLDGNSKTAIGEILMMIPKTVIQLYGDELLEMSDNLIRKIEKLLKRYFSSDSLSSETISNLIDQSEELAQERECVTEEGFISFLRFLIIYKELRLRDMEKDYEKKKREKKELIGDAFDESRFDKEQNIQDSNNKRESFRKIIENEIKESNEHLKETYDSCIQEVTAINEDGNLKFRTSLQALNEFFHSFVIDGQELSPNEFFEMIREVVDNEDFKCEVKEGVDGIIYSDADTPVYVKIVQNERGKFLESVSFISIDKLLA